MTLLQQLGEFLASKERGYEFEVSDVKDMLVEVRLLLEHELDFEREQKTLAGGAAHLPLQLRDSRPPPDRPAVYRPDHRHERGKQREGDGCLSRARRSAAAASPTS